MPSPLGHALAGLSVHVLAARDAREVRQPWSAALAVGAAVAPDLDLLLRLVDGRNHHQFESHSIGAALLAGLAVAALCGLAGRSGSPQPLRAGALAAAAWLSHVLLDWLGRDTHPPIGLMALWPMSHGFYKSPWPLFLDIGRRFDLVTLKNNAVAVAWEAVVLSPVLALAWRARARRRLSDR